MMPCWFLDFASEKMLAAVKQGTLAFGSPKICVTWSTWVGNYSGSMHETHMRLVELLGGISDDWWEISDQLIQSNETYMHSSTAFGFVAWGRRVPFVPPNLSWGQCLSYCNMERATCVVKIHCSDIFRFFPSSDIREKNPSQIFEKKIRYFHQYMCVVWVTMTLFKDDSQTYCLIMSSCRRMKSA
jgi:hypothetical protein